MNKWKRFNLENVDQLDIAAVYSGGSVDRTFDSRGFKLVSESGETNDPFASFETPTTDECDHSNLGCGLDSANT